MKCTRWLMLVLCGMGVVQMGSVEAEFFDVDPTHPYFLAIDEFEREGIVQGYDTGVYTEYKPLDTITRAAALKILTLSAEVPAVEADRSFSDVPVGAWFRSFVKRAVAADIVQGYPDNTFRPAAEVTRAEFLKMASVAFKAPVDDRSADGEWFSPYIRLGVDLNLLPGADSPHEALTRGELAEITYRMKRVRDDGFVRAYRYSGKGFASYYHPSLAGNSTAFGEPYDPTDMTVAHRTLPFNTRLKLTYEGTSVIVRVNDRGPYHGSRVLDLSEAAFTALAPLSRGVIEVEFELLPQTGLDAQQDVPEGIEAALEPESTTNDVPDAIAETIAPEVNARAAGTTFAPGKSVPHIDGDFYETFELRQAFPIEVVAGTLREMQGRTEEYGLRTVKVFLKNLNTNEQTTFESTVSGRNFVVPVLFWEAGIYNMGVVFDSQTRSVVTQVEVTAFDETSLPPSQDTYSSALDIRLSPIDQAATMSWTPQDVNALTRVEFHQGGTKRQLIAEKGLSEGVLPYSLFDVFTSNQPLQISLYHAPSYDGTLATQNGAWRRSERRTYTMLETFEPTITEFVTVDNFSPYVAPGEVRTVTGTWDTGTTTLRDTVSIIQPNNTVQTEPLTVDPVTGRFSVDMTFGTAGTYLLQISTTAGSTVYKHPVHVRPESQWVLPVLPWVQAEVPNSETPQSVLFWANSIRANTGRNDLRLNSTLSELAQSYATQMATEEFISHTAPDGTTFADRVSTLGMPGNFGENLAFATNFPLALNRLETSPTHLDNMLTPEWTQMGVGIAYARNGDVYVTLIFNDR